MANRAMKQKEEKAKTLSREAGEARKYGIRDASTYREEMVNKYAKGEKRPSKAERDADAVTGAATFKASGEKRAAINSRRVKEGKQELKPEIFNPTGREAKVEKNEAEIAGKQNTAAAKKRAAAADAKVSNVDLTPGQKAERKAIVQNRFAEEKAAKSKAKVLPLPKAEAPSRRRGRPQLQPGEGTAGILNPGNIARRAGDMNPRKRRKMERRAAYNVRNAHKSAGYEKAARLAQDTADAVNGTNKIKTEKMDLSARKKAAKMDASKDSLKASIKKRAEKMPEGPEKEAVKNNAEKIIREPKVDGVRGGLHAEITRPDERDITKNYTSVAPVGGVRKTEVAAALPNSPRSTRLPAQKIKMSRGGVIETQPDRPVETGMGLMGSHEDRLYKITKDFQVPAGDTSHPLEHVHLRSFLRHASESKGFKYDERGAIKAVWEAKQKHPEMYKSIHQQALAHRTKRIGQITQNREKSKAKAKEMRQLNSEARGGKRQAPKAIRIMSNVSNKFTEVPRGGSEA
jgi:hypothetical protein